MRRWIRTLGVIFGFLAGIGIALAAEVWSGTWISAAWSAKAGGAG